MDFIQPPYLPGSLTTIERQTVFNLETIMSSLYRQPPTTTYPHEYVESQAAYSSSVMSKRIVPCPDGRMRMIYSIAFEISPMAGFNANGIWNHVLDIAPSLVL